MLFYRTTHLECLHIVASELKDPICHSNECQIGSFSSEAAICPLYIMSHFITKKSAITFNYVNKTFICLFVCLLPLTTLASNPYSAEICINHWEENGFLIWNHHSVLVSSYRFVWVLMLWIYGHYIFLIVSMLKPSLDVRFWHLKLIPRWKG